ncbi:D-amino acid aminotransferase [Salinisphaera sp. P385]|uniref:D-amino acid aminotransferase n=1 Tax=Spectribacter acetivorans TaxID=3075603 RepID=A0ABU3BA46_9GAMM|nr:D-amino acid aminotransferase [Salinisphaera sp. P385]MDT0619109.1 D-amino acid aminotransferase [Salinisphaera sp. P385]
MDTAYLNGRFLPLADAQVPVLDRGFLFGDAVYEVIPVYTGRAYALADHIHRLDRSLRSIGLADPLAPDGWSDLVNDLIARNGGGDMAVYLQVTRGAPSRRDHRPASATGPATVVGFCQTRSPIAESLLEQGIAAVVRDDTRWARCDIKSTALLANVLLAGDAHANDANEAILVRDGRLTEGASSNVFVVSGGTLATPPLEAAILPGITRARVLSLAAANDIPVAQRRVETGELRAADEIWLTSSTREIFPVTRLDGEPVGHGRPGALWTRLRALLQADTHD